MILPSDIPIPQAPLDPNEDKTQLWLGDIQGNILKGHGRQFTALVLFRFKEQAVSNRGLLRAAVRDPDHQVTSALRQFYHAREQKHFPNRPFRSLGLTAAGLAACGYKKEDFAKRPRLFGDDAFWEGMEARRQLKDDLTVWEQTYLDKPHGVWLLACQEKGILEAMIATTELWLGRYGATPLAVERGFRWNPVKGKSAREPFGFADGVFHPRLLSEAPLTKPGLLRRIFGVSKAKDRPQPSAMPLQQVIHTAKENGSLWGSSFLVLRKLEQNVKAFRTAEEKLERELAQSNHAKPPHLATKPKEAGALFIGRERDGTPLVKNGRPEEGIFDFNGDTQGSRCPFHAHIRRMNPRQKISDSSIGPTDAPEQRRIQFLRRGAVYDTHGKLTLKPAPENAPERDVGLLFMAYMSDIAGQFERLQFNWSVDPGLPVTGAGTPDMLFHQNPGQWTWEPPDKDRLHISGFAQFVTPKGGAYFLVAPLNWLKDQ